MRSSGWLGIDIKNACVKACTVRLDVSELRLRRIMQSGVQVKRCKRRGDLGFRVVLVAIVELRVSCERPDGEVGRRLRVLAGWAAVLVSVRSKDRV
jgi:hypothetical protein